MKEGDRKFNDGGRAYPQPMLSHGGCMENPSDYGYGGMSLEQWFAGQALIGILSNQRLLEIVDAKFPETVPTTVAAAKYAFAVAEAMVDESAERGLP